MVQTYTLEGLKKLLRGNVSEKTLEHYKTQGWLVPDHVTPGNIRRYTLSSVEEAKRKSLQLLEQQTITDVAEDFVTEMRWKTIETELGMLPRQSSSLTQKRRTRYGTTTAKAQNTLRAT